MEWNEKRSIFAKQAIQNNSDALAKTHIKLKKRETTQLDKMHLFKSSYFQSCFLSMRSQKFCKQDGNKNTVP